MVVSTKRTIEDWLEVFGHADVQPLRDMVSDKVVNGFELIQGGAGQVFGLSSWESNEGTSYSGEFVHGEGRW